MSTFYQAIRTLKLKNHKIKVSPAMLSEIRWWLACLKEDNNLRLIWDQCPTVTITTDSCNVAGGGFGQSGDWFYTNWLLDDPQIASKHINFKELASVKHAVARWSPCYQGYHLDIHTDNQMTMHAVNKGYSAHPIAASLLKSIASTALCYNVTITAYYLPGKCNDLSDAISRLHAPGQMLRFDTLLNSFYNCSHPTYWLPGHMSHLSCVFLSPQTLHHNNLWHSWMLR
jgi:hypothetical protein